MMAARWLLLLNALVALADVDHPCERQLAKMANEYAESLADIRRDNEETQKEAAEALAAANAHADEVCVREDK